MVVTPLIERSMRVGPGPPPHPPPPSPDKQSVGQLLAVSPRLASQTVFSLQEFTVRETVIVSCTAITEEGTMIKKGINAKIIF